MDSEMAQGQQRPSDIQTHAHTHQKDSSRCQPKRESALLVQLRTEKIGLNDFFFARKVPYVTSPRCNCGARRQTVVHILLHCSKRRTLRNRIFANLSRQDSIRTILSAPQLATKAIEYVEQTQILGQDGDRRREDDS
jgi:hypothetical protein